MSLIWLYIDLILPYMYLKRPEIPQKITLYKIKEANVGKCMHRKLNYVKYSKNIQKYATVMLCLFPLL